MGDGFYILFIYLSFFCFLVLAIISSAIGWSTSERAPVKKAYKWIFLVSVFLLAFLIILLLGPMEWIDIVVSLHNQKNASPAAP